MNDNDNNEPNKSYPPPSQPSANQKDPPPTETAAIETNKNKEGDDKAKLVHKEDSTGSTNSTKPGAVAIKEGDSSKIKKRRGEIPLETKAANDRAVALPGNYPKNEEPGYNFLKNGNQEKVDKKKVMGGTKATLPGAIAVKDSEDSNAKKKDKLRSQMIKRKAAIESTSSLSSDNLKKESQVDTETTTTTSPNIVRENDAKKHRRRLKIKLADNIRNRYRTPFTNDTLDVQENTSESPALSSNVQTNVPFADEEVIDVVFTTSLIEEGVELEQHGGILDEAIENYEMPIATAVNDSDAVLNLPHVEPNYLEEDIVIVDAKVSFCANMK